jgi:dTDP-4-dehydrorhamnose 3,5-epimerase
VRKGTLHGVTIFERPTLHDDRGFFHEVFQLQDLDLVLGRSVRFLQINHSRSHNNVLRGLHAEDWEKLVYAPRGAVFTALADLRPESPTFGQTEVFLLGEANPSSVFIPRGVAHGYCVTSDEADYVYQVSAYYDGSDTRAVAWDDPDLAIDWPTKYPVLSQRDRTNPTMRELFPSHYRARSPISAESVVGVVGSPVPARH